MSLPILGRCVRACVPGSGCGSRQCSTWGWAAIYPKRPYQIQAGQVQPEKQRGFEKLTGVWDVGLSGPSRCSHPEVRGHGVVGAVTTGRFIWTGAPSGVRDRACAPRQRPPIARIRPLWEVALSFSHSC